LTIGTGLGGGGLVNGKLIHGLIHPEMGHIRPPRHPDDDYPGACPFHGDCFEGMAAGPALEGRWGQRGETLPLTIRPGRLRRITWRWGWSISSVPCRPNASYGRRSDGTDTTFPLICQQVQALLNGYVQSPTILEQIDEYIVPPGLGKRAGVLGAIALAQQQLTT